MKERRDSGLEGFLKEGIQERRETRKEGSEQEVCGAVKMLHTHTRDTGKVECWTGGTVGCRTGGMQDSWDSGKEECRKSEVQASRDAGTERFKR